MAYRPLKTTDFSDQLALWAEAEPPRGDAITPPASPARSESGRQPRDAGRPPAPSAVPRPAAARRTDSVSRSERALAAIRAMLSTAN
ncbi:MAG: hypothetical protein MUC55_08640, partial [Burkholderiales bacterium]|nr:hypothetical protein [Burkholderiales bacterium]